jgi:hypothetical protein
MSKLFRKFSMQMLSAVTELGKAKRFHVDTSKWAEALPEAITLVVWPKHAFAFLADKFQLLTGSKHTGAAAFTSLLYEMSGVEDRQASGAPASKPAEVFKRHGSQG